MARTIKDRQRATRQNGSWADDDDERLAMGARRDGRRPCAQPIDERELRHAAHSECPCSSHAMPCLRIDDQTPQELGAKGEDIAAYYLRTRGWEVIERNWTCPYGEADIIAVDDGEVVFVEVKTRLDKSRQQGTYPELAVDRRKRMRYRNMMEHYACLNGCERLRFDVIAVSVVGERTARIHHLVDALEV